MPKVRELNTTHLEETHHEHPLEIDFNNQQPNQSKVAAEREDTPVLGTNDIVMPPQSSWSATTIGTETGTGPQGEDESRLFSRMHRKTFCAQTIPDDGCLSYQPVGGDVQNTLVHNSQYILMDTTTAESFFDVLIVEEANVRRNSESLTLRHSAD